MLGDDLQREIIQEAGEFRKKLSSFLKYYNEVDPLIVSYTLISYGTAVLYASKDSTKLPELGIQHFAKESYIAGRDLSDILESEGIKLPSSKVDLSKLG